MKLEVIYDKTIMECLIPKKVYIKKDELYKISSSERKNLIGELSWKGQYYTIQKGDLIKFDRSNDYDLCYFTLESGTEFIVHCGNPLSFFKEDAFNLIHLEGNPYDERYLEFIKSHPKYK
jgi:hypothetical protein